MVLRELLELNKDCDDLYIRESNGNLSRPLFVKTLVNTEIPNELLDRKVKHFQAGTQYKYGTTIGCLHITLFMN